MAVSSVSGRYRGARDGVEVQLRVDVDGARPLARVSADYLRSTGDTLEYLRSMRIDAPRVTRTAARTTIVGRARFSDGRAGKVSVTIPHSTPGDARATLHHHGPDGRWSFSCVCAFEDVRFRRIDFEEAHERGIDPPAPFDTASLRSRARARTLSTIAAYAEAGLELRSAGEPQIVETRAAGRDAAWSDAELHAAMEQHFTRFADQPQWAIWLLHAAEHTNPRLAGLMFDTLGRQRQGCAVFYGRRPATTDEQRRDRLYDSVHELGHAFNLRHCWERTRDDPPIPSRPQSPTWMNYPDHEPRGPQAFFDRFDYTFDDPETVFLRHAYRDRVIPGGSDFEKTISGSNLRLKLRVTSAVPLHFPVTARLDLSTLARKGTPVPATLDPRTGTVEIAIGRGRQADRMFEPLVRHCRGRERAILRSGDSLIDVPFLHYGTNGFAFDEPGAYRLRARFTAPDGSVALSDVATLLVQPPVSRSERGVAGLLGGDDEIGRLLALMGSRAPELDRGNAKLLRVVEAFPAHPLAAVARLVRGVSLARAFKTIGSGGDVQVAPTRAAEAFELIDPVVDLSGPLRAAARARGEEGQQRAFAAALARAGTRPGISPLVAPFVLSRLDEIAATWQGLASGRPAPKRAPRPRRPSPRTGPTGTHKPEPDPYAPAPAPDAPAPKTY